MFYRMGMRSERDSIHYSCPNNPATPFEAKSGRGFLLAMTDVARRRVKGRSARRFSGFLRLLSLLLSMISAPFLALWCCLKLCRRDCFSGLRDGQWR